MSAVALFAGMFLRRRRNQNRPFHKQLASGLIYPEQPGAVWEFAGHIHDVLIVRDAVLSACFQIILDVIDH